MNPILEGLKVSAIGLVIIFIVMALFMLIMVALQKLFPERPKETVDEGEEKTDGIIQTDDIDAHILVAIVAAISYLRSKSQSQLGSALTVGRGSWWMANRMIAPQDKGLQRKQER